MHTESGTNVQPPFPEFPAAIAAAFLIMSAICLAAPFQDRYVLSAFLAVIGFSAAVVAILTCRRGQMTEVSTTGTDHH